MVVIFFYLKLSKLIVRFNMKYIVLFLFFILLQTNTSHAKWGKGELKLTQETMEVVMMYMYGAGNTKYSGAGKRTHNPTIMAVSQAGTSYMYSYCPVEYHDGCVPPNVGRIIKSCEKYSNGSPCFIFAKKRRIVWKNGGPKVKIKRKDLKSPYKVAKMIQDAGFFDGDLASLAGIDISTGQVNEDITLTGEKEKKEIGTNEKDIVEELETLTKLFDSGALTKQEFEEAKNKLLNN